MKCCSLSFRSFYILPPSAHTLNHPRHLILPSPNTAASFLWKLIPWGPFPLPATIRCSEIENTDWIIAQSQCSVIFPFVTGRSSGSRPYILSDFATPGNSFRLLKCGPNPLLSVKSILCFLFHFSQVSAEAVVLNPAQKLAQTALNWIWWLLRQGFCLFVRADPASFALQFPCLLFSQSHQQQLNSPPPAFSVWHFFTLPWAKVLWNRLNFFK